MTRDEAIELFKENEGIPFGEYGIDIEDFKQSIDKIYDDFESRICDNCKYCEFFSSVNSYFCINELSSAKFVDSCFGCNRWEEKNEES